MLSFRGLVLFYKVFKLPVTVTSVEMTKGRTPRKAAGQKDAKGYSVRKIVIKKKVDALSDAARTLSPGKRGPTSTNKDKQPTKQVEEEEDLEGGAPSNPSDSDDGEDDEEDDVEADAEEDAADAEADAAAAAAEGSRKLDQFKSANFTVTPSADKRASSRNAAGTPAKKSIAKLEASRAATSSPTPAAAQAARVRSIVISNCSRLYFQTKIRPLSFCFGCRMRQASRLMLTPTEQRLLCPHN